MGGIVVKESAYGIPTTVIAFSHKVAYAGTNICGNATPTTTISLAGVLDTDVIQATFKVNASARTILSAVPTANTITITASNNTANTDYVYYTVLRAV
jgi:hypothetical protein